MTADRMRLVAFAAVAILIALCVASWLDAALGAVEFGGLR